MFMVAATRKVDAVESTSGVELIRRGGEAGVLLAARAEAVYELEAEAVSGEGVIEAVYELEVEAGA